ncbi:MAG: extracellular solute-binding protein [Oligoflexales bacterium]|nr:extracellular solute-binding protein [Oligoflexales bacterium]
MIRFSFIPSLSVLKSFLFYSLLLLTHASAALAKDQLIIISPHRKSVEQEIVPAFTEYYKKTYKTEVSVDWLDQGGASDDLRYVLMRFEKNPSSGIDVFWGGGEHPYMELDQLGLLEPHPLPASLKANVPEEIQGVFLYNKKETWHAAALSSFGIFYNKKMQDLMRIPLPETWDDLGDPRYFDNVSSSDPRHSSSFLTINLTILQSKGWEKGWELLTRIAANTRKFVSSSSAPIKAVVAGESCAGLSVDYFAFSKLDELGEKNLGFIYPKDKTIINSDPIAILKRGPNPLVAKRFVEFVLSTQAQKFLLLPKGLGDGPKFTSLGRMSVNRQAYLETEGRRVSVLNPFDLKIPTFVLDLDRVVKLQFVLSDLLGAMLIDPHRELKLAWKAIITKKFPAAATKTFFEIPVSQRDLEVYAEKWSDKTFRNEKINEWLNYARTKYSGLLKIYAGN